MLLVDYFIIGVVGISAVVGLVRGLIKEALSLATWIAAIWIAKVFASNFANVFAEKIDSPLARVVLAGSILFVGVLIIGALVNYLVSILVDRTGLSGTDRVLGMAFGLLRGILISALLLVVAVAWASNEQLDDWREESSLVPYLEQVAVWMRGVLPDEIAEYLRYEEAPGPEETPIEQPDETT